MGGPGGYAHTFQGGLGAFGGRLFPGSGHHHREHNVFQGGEVLEQIVKLEHESHKAGSILGEVFLGRVVHRKSA